MAANQTNKILPSGKPSATSADGEAQRPKNGVETGAGKDPDGMSPKDEERREAAAKRPPAEGGV